jgi:anti-sigma B factor antagonist
MAELRIDTLVTGIRCIYLSGVLDIPAVQKIELKFTACTASYRKPVIVDLSEVTMITSMGVGMILSAARSLVANKGLLVLLKPQPNVEKVLNLAGVDTVVPVEHDLTSAVNRFLAL